MRLITQSCVLFLWMHTLTLVKSQDQADCTREQFFSGNLYDSNFDTTGLEARYPNGKQVRVGCNLGYTGFFKLICENGKWNSRGKPCEPRPCGHPGDAQFADFKLEIGDDFVFGSQVVFTCQKGYQMVSRRNYRRCMAEGWDGVVPVCEAQRCPAVFIDKNVHVIGDLEESTYGNIVRFTCKSSNEILDGSAEMYCDENGEWSGQVPKCKEVQCPVPNIENGLVNGNIQMYKEHDVLHFRCNRGYRRTDSRLSTCTKRGLTAEWSPTPGCEPIKCRLPPPLVGTSYDQTSRNLFIPGETVGVTCGSKYWISNPLETSAVSTCNDNGDWTLEPVCKEVKCSNQRLPNVRWSVSWFREKALDETVGYSCEWGYKKTDGATSAQCTRTGWEPKPLCQEITCDRQDYQNSAIDSDKEIFKYRDWVTYTCNDGYEGDFSLQCGTTGWTKPGQCIKVCKKPHIADAEIIRDNDKNTYRLTDQVRYTCSNNAKRVLTLTCEQSGWTGDMTCSACPTAVVQNGFIVGPHNDALYYTCKEGYKLSTDGWWAEAKCTNGELSQLAHCIANTTCGAIPEIPNRKVTGSQPKDGRITCVDGYYAQVTQLTCQEGKWFPKGFSPKTICTPTGVPCKPPQRVDNAVIVNSYQKEYLSDSKVKYQCRDKYMLLEHEDTIQCKDGQWEKKNITCTTYCDQLKDESMNIPTDKERYMNGDVIEYECVTSRVEGIATCNNTEWNKSVDCKVKVCEKPHIADAEMTRGNDKNTYRLTDQVRYTCSNNAKRVLTLTCEQSGWTGDMTCSAPTHSDDDSDHVAKK